MRIAIERVFLLEFAMDALLALCAIRGRKRIKASRLISGALLGACVTSFCAAIYINSAIAFALRAASMFFTIAIAAGEFSARAFAEYAALSLSIAGLRLIAPRVPFALCVAISSSIALLMKRRGIRANTARVEITFRGNRAAFSALIDSGNRLREPVSGLRAMVVEKNLLESITDDTFIDYIQIPYGGVGGEGTMNAFLPDSISVNSCRADDMWICVYEGHLPGRASALIPDIF